MVVIVKSQDYTFIGAANRRTDYNLVYPENKTKKPVLIFLHGFKGFKDWGYFPVSNRGLAYCNGVVAGLNFSHNGVTPEKPQEFVDLEAFGSNNYSKELEDIGKLLEELPKRLPPEEVNWDDVSIVGHSRGGAIALIAAIEYPIFKKAVTWASVSRLDFSALSPEAIEEWRKTGVRYIYNQRTEQQMPLYFQLYEDYMQNQARFNLEERLKELNKPVLIIHGTQDESVPFANAERLQSWLPNATLIPIEGANHTFGATHPFVLGQNHDLFREVVKLTAEFCFGTSKSL
jgi:pimeloyl-ACP methyl ester carboxylesterase